jgi:hypothetical protein
MDASSLLLAKVLRSTRTVTGSAPALPTTAGEVGLVPEYSLLDVMSRLGNDISFLAGSDHSAVMRFTWLPTTVAVTNPDRASALNRLLAELTGPDADAALASARLRGARGAAPVTSGSGRLPQVAAKPFAVFAPHHINHVFATWYPEDRRVSLLIAVDVSGSMGTPAPGASASAIDMIRQGCLSVAGLLPDDAAVGLWKFGVQLDPPHDYQVSLPIGVLAGEQRQAFVAAVNGLAPQRTGTGLYDTILAAYQASRDSYRPGVPNQVLLFTDGHNDDPNSLSAQDLAARLAQVKDDTRPVELAVVVFGQASDASVLTDVLKPIGGYVETPRNSDDVAAIFIHVAAGGLHG